MMKLTPFAEYLLEDAFADVQGDIATKNMFGGISFYLDGRIFGFIIEDDVLVLKANDESKAKFEDLGGEQFIYDGHKNKGPVGMPYWSVPLEILEDRELLAEWVYSSSLLSKAK